MARDYDTLEELVDTLKTAQKLLRQLGEHKLANEDIEQIINAFEPELEEAAEAVAEKYENWIAELNAYYYSTRGV